MPKCANYRPEDCTGPLEKCSDGRWRCDPHADAFEAQRYLEQHPTGRPTPTTRHAAKVRRGTDGGR